ALALRHRSVEDSVLRQQMKWVRNGAILGVLPFTLMYVIPYTMGAIPEMWMRLSVFSLALIPLTWAYAIARYRLMDVDVFFQQGFVYTLATLSVLGIFYGLVFSVTKFGKVEELSPSGFGVLIIIATFVFQPIRNWIQENLDRYFFYKESYNYRRTLIEFARELSSETDLDRMLASISDRLLRTLSIQHLAFFLASEDDGEQFALRHVAGVRPLPLPEYRDLAFLTSQPDKPYLFFERTRATLPLMSGSWPAAVRQTIAELDLTYYLPCTVRGQTIAYLGVSRTAEGDFLTSDDVELLQTLANYVGIAIENARLYHSLQRKVDEYERLKEFNENIVESINVGILAADLEDRVSSWNNEIERLTGVKRAAAMGRKLAELLPAELVDRLSALRGENGIHHIDKLRLRLAHKAVNGNGSGRNGLSTGLTMREAIVNVAIAPLVSRDQEQIGRLIILDDITDRSELERQLVQADKLSSIGLLAAGVAHEVNTPLAVISTYAQMLAKQVNGDDQKAALLDKIAKQTFRASEIVNSLLNFSRTSTTEYTDLEVNRMIRDTVSLVDHQLKKAQVQVDLALAEQIPAMRGNSGKLQQVLLNLLINSRDALEEVARGEGRRIAIRSYAAADRVFIEVTDNGAGIPAEALPRIFDPFFTTKGARKGTGLGLSVSYGIVQEHGGTIRVESLPGSGTRFRLEFPLARKLQHA
ncbi:MAG: PAS domain S-box protein, partial [Bryobacteraceae bacterium]|nr:PAS domain S-box protein [Bryobacteraceae bacterium]